MDHELNVKLVCLNKIYLKKYLELGSLLDFVRPTQPIATGPTKGLL